MNNALETIFYPFDIGAIEWPDAQKRVLFLNAEYHPALQKFGHENLDVLQHFKPYAALLESHTYKISSITPDKAQYDMILLLAPKNITETQHNIALAQTVLKSGGLLIAAADNKAGGTRLKKILECAGFKAPLEASKNKARVCWAQGAPPSHEAQKWLEDGKAQPVLNGSYISRPGIFGWNKIDKGSELLLQNLPHDVKGKGADYGCGYGYLSKNILEKYRKIKQITAIDADARALECCTENLKSHETVHYIWADLTAAKPPISNLDFIVMNPPFHEGKKESSEIGKAFIQNAHSALARNGRLFMVANAHLPYEDMLHDIFFKMEKLHEGGGFKIFAATK